MMDKWISLDLQFFSEKTEKATPHKKQEARKKGQVAKSADLTNAFVLLFSFLVLALYGNQMGQQLFYLFQRGLSDMLLWHVTQDSVFLLFVNILKAIIPLVAPVLLIAWIVSLAANVAQTGFFISWNSLKGDLNRVNPIEGIKRIFSVRSVAELIKSIMKIVLLLCTAGILLWKEKTSLMQTSEMDVLESVAFIASVTAKVTITLSAVYLVLAFGDFLYQKYDHEKRLRMSKQEMKEEHKKMEGDPLIKHKIKEKQRQVAMSRMIQDIKKAQVVVTNPTHYAVAIAYEAGEMNAPVVVAKGVDYVALKIKEAAKEHRIVTMENKPLARALYASVEIGQEIPEELFKAVAEVLAYVYRVKGTLTR
jgi:flagellar biosynthetic protein FlhB